MTALAPYPRTWAPGDAITSSRDRGDMGNAVAYLTARPMMLATDTTGTSLATGNVITLPLDTELLDNRGGHSIAGPNPQLYVAKVPGWYLCETSVEASGVPATGTLTAGVQATISSVVSSNDGGKVPGNGVSNVGAAGADMRQLSTGDSVALYGECFGATALVSAAWLKTEMVALPSTLGGGLNGTVVTAPQPAAAWPPGSGTTLASSPAAGATSITVSSATGMVPGGSLGLNWALTPAGLMVPVSATAETVTITSVAGTTIGITATANAHVAAEPMSVPVSAAFMNQQARDVISFLAYPPCASLSTSGTAASLPSQVFPAATAITFLAANLDNFAGWDGATKYVFPVSGVYYVYGHVYLNAAATYTLNAGLSLSAGTTAWGTTIFNTSATARSMCATVRRGAMRVTAGQSVQLMASQGSGSSIALLGSSGNFSRLIVVFRGF